MSEKNQSAARAKIPTSEQVSAGGVAFRETDAGAEVAIILAQNGLRWQLPKGLVDAGETPERAAVREVREEAGIEAEPVQLIETVEYWYFSKNKGERIRFHKFVHFFLMKYKSGDTANHDYEVAEARWVKIDEAIEMLAFKSEKAVVEKAAKLITES